MCFAKHEFEELGVVLKTRQDYFNYPNSSSAKPWKISFNKHAVSVFELTKREKCVIWKAYFVQNKNRFKAYKTSSTTFGEW